MADGIAVCGLYKVAVEDMQDFPSYVINTNGRPLNLGVAGVFTAYQPSRLRQALHASENRKQMEKLM